MNIVRYGCLATLIKGSAMVTKTESANNMSGFISPSNCKDHPEPNFHYANSTK
ncbi:hypothetical protein M407DRAFT_153795 [Tulasnella calospora MUT 4182]|uniref:Uncharacterized protein n=1 Tax=Tulasnella calospora MUT 4182 TaxID=1051891 RepID=A0A0C3QPW3_9AGAM|nr:hypothetical protein M407DRAFT_153795 [Tulasnella calospora MUT 4182]